MNIDKLVHYMWETHSFTLKIHYGIIFNFYPQQTMAFLTVTDMNYS